MHVPQHLRVVDCALIFLAVLAAAAGGTNSKTVVAVRDAFFDFFANECPTTTVRAAAEGTGFDPALWSSLAAMGAPGMALPESLGGAGAALTDLAVVADVAGAHLAPVPLIEHAVAARALARAGGHDDLVARRDAASGPLRSGRPVVDSRADHDGHGDRSGWTGHPHGRRDAWRPR